MENSAHHLLNDMELRVDNHAKKELTETAKWSKFIAVTMFVFAALILLFGFIGSSMVSNSAMRELGMYGEVLASAKGWLIGAVLLVSLVISILYYFLYAFSTKVKNAVLSDDANGFTESLKMLKVFFIVTTVFSIIGLLMNLVNLF